jgi:hypothetical protein
VVVAARLLGASLVSLLLLLLFLWIVVSCSIFSTAAAVAAEFLGRLLLLE